MNRKTANRILYIFALLFASSSAGMFLFLIFGNVRPDIRVSLMIQSGILLMCSLWLCVIIYRLRKTRE